MTNATPNENISSDPVNHPSHYTQYPVEVIELTRHMSFDRGNAVKYIARAGFKGGPEKELEDLKKAKWYIEDDIKQLEAKLSSRVTKDPHIVVNIHPAKNISEQDVASATAAVFRDIAEGRG